MSYRDDVVRSIFAGNGDWTHTGTAGEREGEFDAWLQSVKADAWDEGFDSGYDQVLVERAATSRIDLRKNPYRSSEGSGS